MASLMLRRSLSTSGAVQALAKTPITVSGVEGRYAAALYSAATKQKRLDTVEKEVAAVKKLFETDKPFHDYVLNPSIQRTAKKQTVVQVLQKLGHSDTSRNFFAVVAENGRMGKFAAITRAFETIMAAHRGEVTCQVVTAKQIDAGMSKKIQDALAAFAKAGQTLQVSYKVDPKLLGGMTVTVGEKFVDMSLATKIQHYSKLIHQDIV